jgi:hypothetical protein
MVNSLIIPSIPLWSQNSRPYYKASHFIQLFFINCWLRIVIIVPIFSFSIIRWNSYLLYTSTKFNIQWIHPLSWRVFKSLSSTGPQTSWRSFSTVKDILYRCSSWKKTIYALITGNRLLIRRFIYTLNWI